MPSKRVVVVESDTNRPRRVDAIFTLLDGGEVEARYFNRQFEKEVENGLVYTAKTGAVRPRDGRRFYDALDLAFASSSFMFVEEVARSCEPDRNG